MTASDAPAVRRAAPVAVLAGFALLQAVSTARHEMWRDELQAWGVATATPGLRDLAAALVDEGHPPLWYLPLRLLGAVGLEPAAMQVLAWALGVVAAAVVLRCAPVPLWARAAVLFGYHVGYEYTVLARSYTLGLLLLVSALAALTAAPPRRRLATGLIVALALTSAYGAAVAVALGAAVLVDLRREGTSWPRRPAVLVPLLLAGAVTSAAVLVLAARLLEGNTGLLTDAALARRLDLASHGLSALLPLPDRLDAEWESLLLGDLPGRIRLAGLLAVAGIFGWGLRRDRPALTLWVAALTLCLLLATITGAYFLRHLGHVPLALLAAVWYSRRPGAPGLGTAGARRAVHATAVAVVLVGLVAGVLATVADLRRPFSSAEQMAAYLDVVLAPDAQVVADTDLGTSGVAVLLDRGLHRPASDDVGTYVRWDRRTCREGTLAGACVPPEEVVALAAELADRPGPAEVWILTTYPLEHPRTRLVHSVTGGLVMEEDQYLHRLLPP